MFRNVILASDGSEPAARALVVAVELVQESNGKLLVVHADEILGGRGGDYPLLADEEDIRRQLQAKVDELVALGIDAALHVAKGVRRDPADLIADEAERFAADVIVVGTRGHGRVAGMLLGSVTQRLLHVARCPVLAVPVRAAVASEQPATAAL